MTMVCPQAGVMLPAALLMVPMMLCPRFEGVVPSAECPGAQPALAELNAKVAPLVEQYLAALERIKLKEGIRLAMLVSAAGNKFFQARHPLQPHHQNRSVLRWHVPVPQQLCMLVPAIVLRHMRLRCQALI